MVYAGPAPQDGVKFLEAAIREHGAVLAIVDPLARLVRFRDFNDYAEVTAKTELLIEVARNTGCHIAFSHHAGKVERDGGDALLGSTAIFGCVDSAIILRRDKAGIRSIESVQRYGTDLTPTVIALEPSTGLVRAAGDRTALELSDVSRKVLDALGDDELDEAAIRAKVSHRLAPGMPRSHVWAQGRKAIHSPTGEMLVLSFRYEKVRPLHSFLVLAL
jgi:hypothetical protein